MKTQSVNKASVLHDWYLVDADSKTLGRLSTQIANRLRGKHKPEYTPHVDTGDYIVVINADKIHVTGKKETDKFYYHHTGFPGGIKSVALGKMRERSPEKILENAVKGMMPRNRLGRVMLSKLKVYAGNSHPHSAQQPMVLEL
ncbi:MAG: 50S ribosomal protein L13 [Pseudomonadota bacterium]|nr:50S ribosomal protein L13 [Pseudomonadota bacterium]